MTANVLHNPITGQQLIFLQTAATTHGQLLEMESRYPAHSKEPPPHYHPLQKETFLVLKGQMHVRMNGAVKIYNAGDTFIVAPNVVHSMWNDSAEETVVNWKVAPALQTEQFFRTAYGLAQDGKVNAEGTPNLLQTALLLSQHASEFRLAKPSFAVQRLIFGILKPIAKLMGYKAVYSKYLVTD
ncbi:MAG: cupin domain-containing protein [Saprospiraceae bacterium]